MLITKGSPSLVGTPVTSARLWTAGLAPRTGGGWDFIAQAYQYPSASPSEWVVMNLETGEYTRSEGPVYMYMNVLYSINNQLRAPNGRIFFFGLETYGAYFDPTDRQVHQLDKMVTGNIDAISFQSRFGPDGKIYIGTQSITNELPAIIKFDPDTLESEVIGRVGENRLDYSYAYTLYADPPWVYVAVGQNPWELCAINIETSEMIVLATRSAAGLISVGYPADGSYGITATLYDTPSDPTPEVVWCVDGTTYPYTGLTDLPFTPRNVVPVSNPISNPPTVTISRGAGFVNWSAPGSDVVNERSWEVTYTEPVPIESLEVMADGTIIGNAQQYQGFFKVIGDEITWFGAWDEVSQGPRLPIGEYLYITGYPNGRLFRYDKRLDWAPWNNNPLYLGAFTGADAHYPKQLKQSNNGRLYYSGRRERDGQGGGVGWYNIAEETFGGHNDGLNFLNPIGLVVLDDIQRVVYSGVLNDDPEFPGDTPTTAQLVIYNYELEEISRKTVKPGLTTTGLIFPSGIAGTIVGIVDGTDGFIYQYSVSRGALVKQASFDFDVADARYDAVSGVIKATTAEGRLLQIDPTTLVVDDAGPLEDGELLTWIGDMIYYTKSAELWKQDTTNHILHTDNPKGIGPYRDSGVPRPYAIIIKQMRKRR